jgi:hypothetical protein
MANLSYRIVDFNFTKITTVVKICTFKTELRSLIFNYCLPFSQLPFSHIRYPWVYWNIYAMCYKRIRFAHCYATLLTTKVCTWLENSNTKKIMSLNTNQHTFQ